MGAYRRKRTLKLPTDGQVAAIVERIRNPRDRLIFALGWKMGLRASEIAELRIDDLRLGNRPTATVRGKGGKTAELPISGEVLGYLEKALAVRPTNCGHDYLIWNSRKNGPLSRFGIHYLVCRHSASIGLRVWPHLLRHRFATSIYEKSQDINAVKLACRHERISTSSDVYTHSGIQREIFEQLDSRPWLVRFFSKFKPIMPAIWAGRKTPDFIGETVGRQAELAALKANREAGIHSILCGPRGSGKSHLLRLVAGSGVYRLEDLKPPRERLAELAEQMKADGALAGDVGGKSTSRLLKSLLTAVDGKRCILTIDTLDTITADGIALLRKLKDRFVIFSAIDEKQRAKIKEIFFGSADVLDIRNLPADDALHLADAASADVATTPAGREQWLKRVVAESGGNPLAIMEIIDQERRRGRVVGADTEITHEAAQEPLPATPILSALALIAVISRYGASSLGLPDWKLVLIVAAAVVIILVLIDRILKQGARQ